MTAHNVLVLAYYFPPMGLSGVQRIAKFVKYLPDYGWHPHVITTGPVAYYAHDQSLLDELNGREIDVYRTSGTDPNRLLASKGTIRMPREGVRKLLSSISSSLFIPDNKKSWARKAISVAREIISGHKIDVILVTGPPFSSMIAGAQLSAETGIPLVLDYRDLWYGNQFHSYPTPWHARRHLNLEHATLSRASRVVVTNRRIKEKLLSSYHHLTHDDVAIIPHGYDPEDFSQMPEQSLSDSHLGFDPTTFNLTYVGIFYDFVTPVPFFKAVQRVLEDRSDIRLRLHFVGLLRDQYLKKAKRLGVSDLVIDHGYQMHRNAVQMMNESDALWMMVGNTRNADTISSGKLYEYFGTGKPILVSVPEGTLRRDSQRYGAAWITDPDDVNAIAVSIAEMYDRWKSRNPPIPDAHFIEQFDRRILTADLSRVLATSLRVI